LGTKHRCTSDSSSVYARGGGGDPGGPAGLTGRRTFHPYEWVVVVVLVAVLVLVVFMVAVSSVGVW
jgi:hypothetical protein